MTDDDREALTAYLDGELDETAEQAFEARLSQDPTLRAELDAMKQAWGLLDYLPNAPPSDDFTHRTLDRLSLETTRTAPRGWSFGRVARWAACALIALGVGIGASVGYRKYTLKPIDSDAPIVRNLRVLERFFAYDSVEDLEFLKALDDPDLFGEDGEVRGAM
jgi:anti-sigma factor RsiW